MSIGCTEMARKVRKKHNEQIGAETTKKWKKIAKTNLPLSGEIKSKWRRLLLQSRNATKIAIV